MEKPRETQSPRGGELPDRGTEAGEKTAELMFLVVTVPCGHGGSAGMGRRGGGRGNRPSVKNPGLVSP